MMALAGGTWVDSTVGWFPVPLAIAGAALVLMLMSGGGGK